MTNKFSGLSEYILWGRKKLEEFGAQGYNVRGWKIEWMKQNSIMKCGTCDYKNKTIWLNHDYFYLTPDHDVLIGTLLHEFAHLIHFLLDGHSDHSPRWKAIARSIGCDGERLNAEAVMPNKRTKGLSYAVPSFDVD